MRVAVIGGGPAGLYFALLLKNARPETSITVLERNRLDETFGWGVVFSDQTLENFRAADPETCDQIVSSFAHWDDIDVHVHDRVITSSGHGFAGIARRRLLQILQDRAAGLGVTLRAQTEIADERDLPRLGLTDLDLIVAADGVNSAMRARHASQFQPDLDVRPARYIWLGTTRLFDAFTFIFVENEWGVFQVHAYRFDEQHSAFIVECDEASWCAAQLDRKDADATVRWYIDPIDGTHNFIRGVPLFGTLLAVERDGELQAAVLSAPALDERWWAHRGGGAWARHHGASAVRIRVSGVTRLDDAQVLYGGGQAIAASGLAPGFGAGRVARHGLSRAASRGERRSPTSLAIPAIPGHFR